MEKYLINQLEKIISIDSPTGYTKKAVDYVKNQLESMGYKANITNKGCLICEIGGESSPIILSAHLDTLGGMVQEIKPNGRLKLTKLGGLRAENIEGENCVIYNRFGKTFTGCFMLNNPSIHVNKGYGDDKRDFDNMEVVLDHQTKSVKETEDLGISVGDYVCFDPRYKFTEEGYIKSRFLDDKLSASILLTLAKKVSSGEITLKRKTYLMFTVYEEVGHGAAGGLPTDAVEILSVDMGCVGDGLTCTEREVSICVKDSNGPYNFEVTTNLIRVAKENGIKYAADVYPFYGSDADCALAAGYDIKHGLIGAGVYASHGYERSHIEGAMNTLKLLEKYVG